VAKLKEGEARLFSEPNYAVASTVRGDGCPQQTVVWVDYDGEDVLFNTAEGRAKPKYIRANGRAGVHVTHPEDPYKWVSVAGPAELSHEGADEHIDKLAKKYLGADSYPFRKAGEQRVIVRIKPEHVNSSGLDGG
jgi:PPOX class probable F420-dependent enzyme